MVKRIAVGLVSLSAALYALNWLARRWGATDDEVSRKLPGDEILSEVMVETTHAVTVHAPAESIWPWLVQAGYHRGGWYGDDKTEQMFMKFFWRLIVPRNERAEFRPSADRILPEFQNLKVGDIVPDGPPDTAYFTVMEMEANRHLVLYSDTHLPSMAPGVLRGTGYAPYGEFTWVFVLDSINQNQTRLILRNRANYGPPIFRLLSLPFMMLAEVLFPYQILNGIKRRAEKLALSRR